MSKHTPEPWEAGEKPYIKSNGEGDQFSNGDWHIFPPLGECGPVAVAGTGEDASRIVECVNALKSLNPSAISRLLESCDTAVSGLDGDPDEGWLRAAIRDIEFALLALRESDAMRSALSALRAGEEKKV